MDHLNQSLDAFPELGYVVVPQLVSREAAAALYEAVDGVPKVEGLGATGLTFCDDDVTEFLAPGTGLSPMLCAAVGVDARRPR